MLSAYTLTSRLFFNLPLYGVGSINRAGSCIMDWLLLMDNFQPQKKRKQVSIDGFMPHNPKHPKSVDGLHAFNQYYKPISPNQPLSSQPQKHAAKPAPNPLNHGNHRSLDNFRRADGFRPNVQPAVLDRVCKCTKA